MSETTDPVRDKTSPDEESGDQEKIDLNELAEEIVKLLRRELEIEKLRTGK